MEGKMETKYGKYVHGTDGYPKVIWIVKMSYNLSIKDVEEMFSEIQKDFPMATSSEVTVSHLGGNHFNRLFSIEYMVSEGTPIPECYIKRNLESTFHK
jgi:hypothetical protein